MNKKFERLDVERLPVQEFMERAYLDYSMYVILDRALPHIGDGLKPVQRRIVYAMSELGLSHIAKYKKSARTIGDVLGKFHPHGDTACYEAMVLMAQPFSYRYPLVDGQGNWGSSDDPKSFAAMRYTEAKLTKYAQSLLQELNQGAADWQTNFDGTLEEPKVLPAMLPNVLLNGTSGIAVGMATDIPPHNLSEVIAACIHLLDNPRATVRELCQFLPAPDFPTQAEIINSRSELINIYETGSGSVRMRAVYTLEDNNAVIMALPYQTSGSKILEQIADQMRAGKLPMVADLRDESDHENPTRLIIEPRSNRVDVNEVMNHLFATTDLERSYKVNFNMIGLNGKPQVKNLAGILSEWLEFRRQTVTRRLQYQLDKINLRLHVLEGLLIAYLNIDAVIKIIRNEDEPKPVLVKKFALSEAQAEAVLELKLRHLAKLEEIKIKAEQSKLAEEQKKIQQILESPKKLTNFISRELQMLAKEFGDLRNSPLVERQEAKVIEIQERLPVEAVTVILSQMGWIRVAKSLEIEPEKLNYKAGDGYLVHAQGKSNQDLLLWDNTGRSYMLSVHDLPSARGYGEPVTSKLSPPDKAKFINLALVEPEQKLVLAADNGYGFICKASDLATKNKTGKQVLKLAADAQALAFNLLEADKTDLAIFTTEGYLLVYSSNDLAELAKGKGVKLITLGSAKDRIAHLAVIAAGKKLLVNNGKQTKEISAAELKEYRGKRAQRGHKLPPSLRKLEWVAGA